MTRNQFFYDIIVDEQLLFTIMNELFDVVFLMKVEAGPKFRYVRASSHALYLANLTEKDIGKCIEDIYPKEMAAYLNKQYRKALETRKIVTYRDQVNIKGEWRIAESMIVPVFTKDGTMPYMVCFTRDITEQIAREKQFEEIHQLFHSFLEQTHDAIVMFDLAGRVLRVNREAERLLGWSEKEVLAKKIADFLPGHHGKLQQSLQKLSRGQTLTSVHLSLVRKDGKKVHVSANVTPVFGNDGTAVAGLSILRDMTDFIQVREQLQQSEELYRKVIEFLPDPIIIQADGVIHYMNPAGLEMVKAERIDFVKGKRLSDFLEKREQQENEWVLTSLCGEQKEVDVKAMSIDYYGQSAQFLIIRDLSEQKSKEKKIEFMAQYDPITVLPNRNYLREN